MRGTVRTRNDAESGEVTKKHKIRCLNLCNVDNRDVEDKLVENEFVVTSYQQSREQERDTASFEDT